MRESELISLLDRCDIEHKPSVAGTVPIVFRDSDGDQVVGTVKLSNGGDILQMRVPLLRAPDSSYRSVLLQALLHMTFRYKMLKFGFDPSDGGIVIDIDICLSGGADFQASQMNRCMRLLKKVTATGARRIIKIKATGEDPGEEGVGRGALDALAALAAGSGGGEGGEAARLARALAAMAALRGSGESGDGGGAAGLARALAELREAREAGEESEPPSRPQPTPPEDLPLEAIHPPVEEQSLPPKESGPEDMDRILKEILDEEEGDKK
ncbi:hypothetical protein ACFL3S_04745 [Gemmatimonadota bacterium]